MEPEDSHGPPVEGEHDHDDVHAEAVPPAPPPVLKAVEEWAKAKGHTRTIEHAGKKHLRMGIEFACAKTMHGWGIGRELSEAEYDNAVKAAMSVVCR